MKTLRHILTVLFLLMMAFCQAQSIDPTSVWRTDFSIWDPVGGSRNEYFKNYINGDTLINGLTYAKVYKSGYFIFGPDPNQVHYNFNGLDHLLRAEGKKWYTVDNNNGEVKLLYDFTLQVGDTVRSAFTFSMEGPIIISSIDSVLMEGVWKKQFHLDQVMGAGATLIIEDMGANSGLFENMSFFEWGSWLHCFAHGNTVLWSDTNYVCDLNVSVPEDQINHSGIFIYPNPATDFVNIILPSGEKSSEIEMINSFGKTILHQTYLTGTTVTIPLKEYPKGMYMVKVTSGNRKQVGKLVSW